MRIVPLLVLALALAGCASTPESTEPPLQTEDVPQLKWIHSEYSGSYVSSQAVSPASAHGIDTFLMPSNATVAYLNGTLTSIPPGETKVTLTYTECNSCQQEITTINGKFSQIVDKPHAGEWFMHFFPVAGAQQGTWIVNVTALVPAGELQLVSVAELALDVTGAAATKVSVELPNPTTSLLVQALDFDGAVRDLWLHGPNQCEESVQIITGEFVSAAGLAAGSGMDRKPVDCGSANGKVPLEFSVGQGAGRIRVRVFAMYEPAMG